MIPMPSIYEVLQMELNRQNLPDCFSRERGQPLERWVLGIDSIKDMSEQRRQDWISIFTAAVASPPHRRDRAERNPNVLKDIQG